MEVINVLWTGGFDSTFVICQLSLLPVEVQPIYISMGRKSEPNELKAIQTISDYINANAKKRCTLLPLSVIKQDDIPENKQITESYQTVYKKYEMGYQQERIARLARHMGTKLVQGIEDGPGGTGHVSNAIREYSTMIEGSISLDGGDKISFYEMDAATSTREMLDIFGGVIFTLPLWHITKPETLQIFKEIGYEEVVPMTWFCAQPIKGKPCGLCNPCGSTMDADMGFRLPRKARILYKLTKKNRVGKFLFVKLRLIYYRFR